MPINSLHADSHTELQVEAGAAFKNLGSLKNLTPAAFRTLLEGAASNPAKRLGSVDGGFRFTAKTESRKPSVDGLSSGVKGYSIPGGVEVRLSFTSRAITPEMWALAMGGGTVTTTGTGHKIITPRLGAESGSYIDDLTFVGEMNDGKSVVAVWLKNVLNTAGVSFQSTNNGEGGFSFDLQAHMDDPWDDEPPYEVHYFTS